MGAELIGTWVKKTGNKEETFKRIAMLDDKQLNYVADIVTGEWWPGQPPDEAEMARAGARAALIEAVEVAYDTERRDTFEMTISEPGTYVFTGGMSYGDDPTDAFRFFLGLDAAGIGEV